eukprot:TRINITY_DN87122_c0_g1_i1.p1 TRINITY_DN87122_c0_g1~~TRINITY_DN87122_c0_g1_i1.p1  ORF type:complete len:163 (+),score=9.63 TRINITY_DN87122_c0_g1_i1:117-605(+)
MLHSVVEMASIVVKSTSTSDFLKLLSHQALSTTLNLTLWYLSVPEFLSISHNINQFKCLALTLSLPHDQRTLKEFRTYLHTNWLATNAPSLRELTLSLSGGQLDACSLASVSDICNHNMPNLRKLHVREADGFGNINTGLPSLESFTLTWCDDFVTHNMATC